jgi:hypothetical protein
MTGRELFVPPGLSAQPAHGFLGVREKLGRALGPVEPKHPVADDTVYRGRTKDGEGPNSTRLTVEADRLSADRADSGDLKQYDGWPASGQGKKLLPGEGPITDSHLGTWSQGDPDDPVTEQVRRDVTRRSRELSWLHAYWSPTDEMLFVTE